MAENREKGERIEIIHGDVETGEVDMEEVLQRATEWAMIVARAGGSVQIGADREELVGRDDQPTGMFLTTRVVFRWASYMPSRRAAQVVAAPEPVEEPDEELDDRAPEPVTAA